MAGNKSNQVGGEKEAVRGQDGEPLCGLMMMAKGGARPPSDSNQSELGIAVQSSMT